MSQIELKPETEREQAAREHREKYEGMIEVETNALSSLKTARKKLSDKVIPYALVVIEDNISEVDDKQTKSDLLRKFDQDLTTVEALANKLQPYKEVDNMLYTEELKRQNNINILLKQMKGFRS